MLVKPTPQQTKELQNLRNSGVQEYMVALLEKTMHMLVTQPDPDAIKLLQGRAQTLLSLLEQIDSDGFSTNGKRG